MEKEQCPDCKSLVSKKEGEHPHPYIGGSPGCWFEYGKLLAREYENPEYHKVHRFTVDAYCAQHPGKATPQAIQSVNVHLFSLYLILKKGVSPSFAGQSIGTIIKKHKDNFKWLEPPQSLGNITVVDVLKAKDAQEHEELVKKWALSVWNAWKPHHKTIAEYAKDIL